MIEENGILHAIASSASCIGHDFLVQILGIERDGVGFRVVQGQVFVRHGGDLVCVERGEEVDIQGRV